MVFRVFKSLFTGFTPALVLLDLAFPAISFAQPIETEKFALVVGINEYKAPPKKRIVVEDEIVSRNSGTREFSNLFGAVNDARAFQGVLVTRFGVSPDHIKLLLNESATRDSILFYLTNLAKPDSKKPREVLFYFAGHGSQIYNAYSDEPNHLDETLVPSDSRKGAPDIRDKELRVLFNRILDSGAKLTVVIDACHSGSVARSFASQTRSRSMEPSTLRIADSTFRNLPVPEDRGALVFSAAQDYQTAKESFDGDHHRGLFTRALTQVYNTEPAETPIDNIFQRVRALMQTEGDSQEPVLGGQISRLSQPLLTSLKTSTKTSYSTAVRVVWDADDIELMTGLEAGLFPGVLLASTKNPETHLRIREASQIGKSVASLAKGTLESISPGTLFTVLHRPPNAIANPLKIYVPKPLKAEKKALADLQKLDIHRNDRWQWASIDTLLLFPEQSARLFEQNGTWMLSVYGKAAQKVGSVGKSITLPASETFEYLVVTLPPTQAFSDDFLSLSKRSSAGFRLVQSRDSALFSAYSVFSSTGLSSIWIRNGNETQLPQNTFPVRSALESESQLSTLSRSFYWLNLPETPPDSTFPFSLSLKESSSKTILRSGHLSAGASFGLVLTPEHKRWSPQTIQERFIYIFALDGTGASTLLFPARGNVENRFPYKIDFAYKQDEIVLTGPDYLTVGNQFERTTLVMVTSETAIGNPALFEWDSIGTANSTSPSVTLSKMLETGRRDLNQSSGWSVQRLSFTTGILSASKTVH